MAFSNQLMYTGGRHANADLEGLDFFWYADLHVSLSRPELAGISRDNTPLWLALACELRDILIDLWQFLRPIDSF
jgi:hypothetical protein